MCARPLVSSNLSVKLAAFLLAQAGAAIGACVGGPVGAAVGGIVSGVVGGAIGSGLGRALLMVLMDCFTNGCIDDCRWWYEAVSEHVQPSMGWDRGTRAGRGDAGQLVV